MYQLFMITGVAKPETLTCIGEPSPDFMAQYAERYRLLEAARGRWPDVRYAVRAVKASRQSESTAA